MLLIDIVVVSLTHTRICSHRPQNPARRHPRQTDVGQLCWIIAFHSIVDIPKQGICHCSVLMFPTTLQVNVHLSAPLVLPHDPHKFRKTLILCPICIVPQCNRNRCCDYHGQHRRYLLI